MGKQKTDSKSDSSTELEQVSKAGSAPDEEQVDQIDLSQEDEPGAVIDPDELNDDASFENLYRESQRRLEKAEEREDKQYDHLAELTHSLSMRPAEVQINREDVQRREQEELEELGVEPGMGPYIQRKIDAGPAAAGFVSAEDDFCRY